MVQKPVIQKALDQGQIKNAAEYAGQTYSLLKRNKMRYVSQSSYKGIQEEMTVYKIKKQPQGMRLLNMRVFFRSKTNCYKFSLILLITSVYSLSERYTFSSGCMSKVLPHFGAFSYLGTM